MASKQFAVFDLGSKKATLAYFEGGEALTLSRIASAKIEFGQLVGPSKISVLTQIISSLAAEIDLPKKSLIRFSVPSQSVFIRFAKFNALEGADLKQLASFELQQQLPVAVDQVAWDYHQFASGGGESEVALVAARKQDVDDLHQVITSLGYQSTTASIAALSALNSFHSTYGDLEEPSLLIDVREKTTNLIYTSGELFYIRSVNFGLSSLVSEIARSVEATEDVVEQLISSAFLPLDGNAYPEVDPNALTVGTGIKNGLNRLTPQIIQTTAYFKSHFNGGTPANVFISGELSGVFNLNAYLGQALSAEVQNFNPTAGREIDAVLDPASHGLSGEKLAVVYGLAVQEVETPKFDIKLTPSAVNLDAAFEKEKPLYFGLSFLIAAAAALVAIVLVLKTKEIETSLGGLKSDFAEVSHYHKKIKTLERGDAKLSKENLPLLNKYLHREKMLRLISQVSPLFSADEIWMSNFEFLVNYSFTGAEQQGEALITDDLSEVLGNKSFVRVDAESSGSGRRRVSKEINAVKIKGFWVKNEDNQDIVTNLLSEIEKNCEDLTLSFKNRRKVQKLENSQVIKNLENPTINADQKSWGFELIIPLKDSIKL